MNYNPVILPHIYSQPDNPECITDVNTTNVSTDSE